MSNEKIAVSAIAPQFTLKDQDGNKVQIADFVGKKNVVLIFYPGDMTPGCTTQLCSIRDDWSKFQQKDTVVFGINHGDDESHKQFQKKYGLPFPLLIDTQKTISTKYEAIRPLFKSKIIKRTVVVIGKNGKITYIKRGMPKNADILKSIV